MHETEADTCRMYVLPTYGTLIGRNGRSHLDYFPASRRRLSGAEDCAQARQCRPSGSGGEVAEWVWGRVKMKAISLVLVFVLVGVCLGAELQPRAKVQGKEPSYEGKTLSEWTIRSKDRGWFSDWRAAILALGEIGPPAVPALTELLKDKDTLIRVLAAQALGKIGPEAKTAVPVLTELLKDKDSFVRTAAMMTLAEIGPAVVPTLTQLLTDKDWQVRRAATWALGDIGSEAKTTIPMLTGLLKEDEASVRRTAAWALGRMGSEAKIATEALTELLKDKDWEVRRAAAWALGQVGPEATTAVPVLTELLKDEYKDVRRAAINALDKIKEEKK